MFSKSLFKQSCKANGFMWIVITFAVCFMLCCVMLIAGNGKLGETKIAVEDAVVNGEISSETEGNAVTFYEISDGALKVFDTAFQRAYIELNPTTPEQIQAVGLTALNAVKNNYYAALLEAKGYAPDSEEATELAGIVFYALNPNGQFDDMFDYEKLGMEKPKYDVTDIFSSEHETNREKYAMKHMSNFLAANMIKPETVNTMLAKLEQYSITAEKYHEFGFDNFDFVKSLAENAIVDYRANLEYRMDNIKEGETEEQIKNELIAEFSGGLLANLPDSVSQALQEIGAADLYGTLVGSIFFKMAGLLLPIIYMIMASNALIAGQVDSGSMAYVLSTGTKRREVVFTQAVFLITSLLAMFVCTALTSVICFAIVNVNTDLDFGKLLLINLGAFLVMFAMSGISFLASCVFNRSKNSMALGGGLNMFFLVATMLGLFGSPVLPSIIRMKALNAFNYVSIISLFDVISVLEGTFTFLWKLGILAVIGIVCYITGSIKFQKKDLPL